MCDPVTAIIGGIASAIVGSIFKPDQPTMQAPQSVQAPPAPQAAQQPDEAGRRKAAPLATNDSPSSTLLTGPGGVSADETKTKLGRNVALGA